MKQHYGDVSEYGYDDLYRLTDVRYPNGDIQTYTYDPMGNRLSKTENGVSTTYSYDDADQMTLADGVTYDYDGNGNQVEAATDTFGWDADNRLIETNILSTTGVYHYNGDGLRTTRTIGASAVSYVWDLNASLPIILLDTDGNRFVYGRDLLTRIDGTDEEWYLYDGLGSTTGLTADSGDVAASYEYDVFGAVRAHSGGASEWLYAGEQHDPTGLVFLRARYYDEASGRFLSPDPLPLVQRYPYGLNNPTRFVDPTGLCVFGAPCPSKLEDAGECIKNRGDCIGIDDAIESAWDSVEDAAGDCWASKNPFSDGCLTLIQQIDLVPLSEACFVVGAAAGTVVGPLTGAGAYTACEAVEVGINYPATGAAILQTAFSECPFSRKIGNGVLIAVNHHAEVLPVLDSVIEGYLYDQQVEMLDCKE